MRIVLATAMLAFATTSARALPDLAPELYDARFEGGQTVGTGDVAEGCAGATDDRLLLRFGVRFHNVGPDALVIGDPGCPDCATSPGALCEDPRFICSPADGHNHPHFISFADYELLDFQGNSVRSGGKKSFCVRDNTCPEGTTPVFNCTNQGISPGCLDDYDPSLGCQYIDVTDVPDATTRAFRLRATLDPDQELPDANRTNNVAEVVIPGCGDGILQAGEECDPGATPADPCCGADCRLAPPGSPCEPPAGPCGSSGGAFVDGTPCGPGAPPCVVQVCRSGLCQTETGSGGCLIGATCFAPGALDPVDPCQRCDPSQRTETWSRNMDPDPAGIRCEAARAARALAATTCTPRIDNRLTHCLLRIYQSLHRLDRASPRLVTRLKRRLGAQVSRLAQVERRAERAGCDVGTFGQEVRELMAQVSAYRTSH